MLNHFEKIMAYEAGELEEDEVIELFQDLINSGQVWSLQGHYGRTAIDLLRAGLCETVSKSSQLEAA
jgi:hypothetical protein